MTVAPLINSLIRTGELVLWHDYRKGTFQDLSGNGNHGTPSGVEWYGNRLYWPDLNGKVVVANSPELELTSGTLIVLGALKTDANRQLITKRDGGGTNFSFFFSTSRMYFDDGLVSRSIVVGADFYIGKRSLGLTFVSGQAANAYIDGLLQGLLNGTSTVTAYDVALNIGNFELANSGPPEALFESAMVINRALTESEMAQIYGELEELG